MSRNKRATQSTTALSSTDAFIASNAVDRDIMTCMRAKPIGTSSYKSMWWTVDLGGVYNIYSVNILFKNYEGYGLVYLAYFGTTMRSIICKTQKFYRESKLWSYYIRLHAKITIFRIH